MTDSFITVMTAKLDYKDVNFFIIHVIDYSVISRYPTGICDSLSTDKRLRMPYAGPWILLN